MNNRGKEKKALKLENKKKKLAALLTLCDLNEEDRRRVEFFKKGIKYEPEVIEQAKEEPPPKKPKVANDVEHNKTVNPMTEAQLKELRKLVNIKRALKKKIPDLTIHESGQITLLETPVGSRKALFLSDVQHFLIYSQMMHFSFGNIPSWITIEKANNLNKTVFIMIEGISLKDYSGMERICPNLSSLKYKFEIITPLSYGGNLLEETATLPLTNTQINKLSKKFGSLKEALTHDRVMTVMRTIYPISDFNKLGEKLEEKKIHGAVITFFEDKFPRTKLILSPWQMVEENYPIPGNEKFAHYKFSKQEYGELTDSSPMFAVDCEMCMTQAGSELTKIAVVNEKLQVVYSSFVKPYLPITNYLTRFSGVTAKDLVNVWTRVEDVQDRLREILPSDAILVGHSLENDLHALQLMHPYIIDTSLIFNLSGVKSRKTKLRVLAAEFLSEVIQDDAGGHNPAEDAIATMKLLKTKLAHSFEWGNAVLSGLRAQEETMAAHMLLMSKVNENREKRKEETEVKDVSVKRKLEEVVTKQTNRKDIATAVDMYTTSLFKQLTELDKKVLLLGKENEIEGYTKYLPTFIRPDQEDCRVQRLAFPTNKMIIKYGRNNALKNCGTTFMHVKVNNLSKADRLVGKFLKNRNIEEHILFIVLLAGKNSEDVLPEENHGVLFVNLYRGVLPKINFTPNGNECP